MVDYENKASIFISSFICGHIVTQNTLLAATPVELVSLQADNFEHIQFKRIKASAYTFHDDQLKISVDDSASFLMKAFDTVKDVNKVSFEWRSEGAPKVKDAEHEEKRKGDDAVFKLGLLLETEEDPFLPVIRSWAKRVQALLKFPSEKMIYLTVDAKHTTGEQWRNPYNKRVTMVSVASVEQEQGWMKVSHQFKHPVKVVAIWLMADGDNTDSSFTSYIRNIHIE